VRPRWNDSREESFAPRRSEATRRLSASP